VLDPSAPVLELFCPLLFLFEVVTNLIFWLILIGPKLTPLELMFPYDFIPLLIAALAKELLI